MIKTQQPLWARLFFPVIFTLVIGSVAAYHLPQYRFWNSELENNITWCKHNVGGMNLSAGPRDSWCWGQGWEYYCKDSYPAYCPGQTDTYAQCLENCNAYGTKNCPCTK